MEDSSFFWLVSGVPAIIGLCLGYIICHVRNKEPHPDIIYMKKRLGELTDVYEKASEKIDFKLYEIKRTVEQSLEEYKGTISESVEDAIDDRINGIHSKLEGMKYDRERIEKGIYDDFEYVKQTVYEIKSELEYSWVYNATFRRQALTSILVRLDKNRVLYKKILDEKIDNEIDLIFDKAINAIDEHRTQKVEKMYKQAIGVDLNE
ncbi:hypothetical protein ABRH25_001198 [Salmonella enterica subsp. enterica]